MTIGAGRCLLKGIEMKWAAVIERCLVALVVGYFAYGAYNEIDLEKLDSAKPNPNPVRTSYHGIDFESAEAAVLFKREVFRNDYFVWAGLILTPVCYVMVASAAGCYGGLFREITDTIYNPTDPKRRYVFGLVWGPFLYGISSALPYVLIETDSLPTPRFAVLIGGCLVGGCFAEETWQILKTLPTKFLKHIGG